jgi:transposase
MAKESVYERLTGGDRKHRKDLQRRLHAENPGLDVVHANAAGIDIGNESHFVAVPPAKDAQSVREFGSWTADLERMAAWLQSCGIETVAMQSTGVYWFAVYDVLEKHGFKVFLVNARHTRNLPGRKSDVQESQWLMKLHTYGLLRNSFRPPEQIRPIRAVWRLRDRHVQDAGRSVQHMQKALTSMNVQLANAISDIAGASGQAIIRSILAGERDPRKLAQLCNQRIQASAEEVARSLEGNWQEDQLFELRQAVEEYDFWQKQIAECDRKLQAYLAVLPTRTVPPADSGAVPPPPTGGATGKKKKRAKKAGGGNAPSCFDLAAELTRITGVDALRVDGINLITFQTVVAELGTELGNWFPTEFHFASWLRLTPRRDVSGGKVIRHLQEKSRNRVAYVLRMAANALLRSDSYLGARYRSLRTRLGSPKAIKAMARYLACILYRLFTKGQAWVDRGAEHFERNRHTRELARLQAQANSRGFRLVPVTDPQA